MNFSCLLISSTVGGLFCWSLEERKCYFLTSFSFYKYCYLLQQAVLVLLVDTDIRSIFHRPKTPSLHSSVEAHPRTETVIYLLHLLFIFDSTYMNIVLSDRVT